MFLLFLSHLSDKTKQKTKLIHFLVDRLKNMRYKRGGRVLLSLFDFTNNSVQISY